MCLIDFYNNRNAQMNLVSIDNIYVRTRKQSKQFRRSFSRCFDAAAITRFATSSLQTCASAHNYSSRFNIMRTHQFRNLGEIVLLEKLTLCAYDMCSRHSDMTNMRCNYGQYLWQLRKHRHL